MPPKAKAQGTSKKADQKKKERVIEVSLNEKCDSFPMNSRLRGTTLNLEYCRSFVFAGQNVWFEKQKRSQTTKVHSTSRKTSQVRWHPTAKSRRQEKG